MPTSIKFSANIGFLWPELSLVERIHAAQDAGFNFVECHFPYDTPAESVRQALQDTGLKMLCLNTQLGIHGLEDFGVAARPGREHEAQQYIDEALDYAGTIGCPNINVVPGKTERAAGCEATFQSNLSLACEKAADARITVFIEPINQRSAPKFHCSLMADALNTVKAVGCDNLKIMFDCFHVQITEGDLLTIFQQAQKHIGHIQFSAIHDRGEPDVGEINYPWLLDQFTSLGWNGCVGAEYQPRSTTEAGLDWLSAYP